MKRVLGIILLMLLPLASLWSQRIQAEGQGRGETQEIASLKAKQDALDALFVKIGKDTLFQEVFIKGWPEALEITGEEITLQEDGTFAAYVLILLDSTALNLAQNQYMDTASRQLQEAEDLLTRSENSLIQASGGLDREDFSQARIDYHQSGSFLDQAEKLISPILDDTVRTLEGNNRTILLTMLGVKKKRVEDGLSRLDEIEALAQTQQSDVELNQTYNLYYEEQKEIVNYAETLGERSPFFEEDPEVLGSTLTEIELKMERISQLQEEYRRILTAARSEQSLFKSKVQVALNDLEELQGVLEQYRKEAELEKTNPRMVRLEKEKARKEALQQWKKRALWFVDHPVKDHVAFRYYLPFRFTEENRWEGIDDTHWSLRGEWVLSQVWLRTVLDYQEHDFINNEAHRLSQQISLGLGRKGLFGFGFQWDWFYNGNTSTAMPRQNMASIYLGGINRSAKWASWVLAFNYRIPQKMDPFVATHLFNGEVSLLGRLEKRVKLEASIGSYTETIMDPDLVSFDDSLAHIFHAQAGIGVRVPRTILWGVKYDYQKISPIIDGDPGNPQEKMGWQFYVEYNLW